MLSSKKAISPLIAAVLLIVVVVGIGAVITGMMRGMVTENRATIESKSAEISCSTEVVLEVVNIDGVPQVCKGADYIDIVLENTGKDIEDFQLMVFGTSGFAKNESISAGDLFELGEAQEFNASFDPTNVGTVQQVKFVPMIKKPGSSNYFYCNDVAITYEEIDDC